MSYDVEKKKIGRQACTVVELLLDYCQLTYGTAPCTAAVGVTGTQKCFNTRKTCQDAVNYDPAAKSYRFSNTKIAAPDTAIASIVSVSLAPTKIDPGKSLGYRASVTVTLKDHPGSDTDVDKYFRTRSYTPMTQGTYWGKLLARNPYYQNRLMKIYDGFLVDGVFDPANFKVRTYAITQIDGPDTQNYQVKITAKDPLVFADNKKAQAPFPNSGVLAADITDSGGSLTLSPAGIGDLEYANSGVLAIGNECMRFTRTTGSDVCTLVERGSFHTGPDSYITVGVTHSAGDAVQQCLQYDGTFITDVMYDLLTTYGNVPASFIDKTQWDAEANVWLSQHNLTTVIPKPMGVTTLINELIAQCLCYIWWDERAQTIPFRAIRPALVDEATSLNEKYNIIADSAEVSENPSERLSDVLVYFSQFNPMLDLSRVDNYDNEQLSQDGDARSDVEYGEVRIQKIFSRWFTEANTAQALVLGQRLLKKYRNNPKTLTFKLDVKDSAVWTGSFITISTRAMQDESGASPAVRMEVLSAAEVEVGSKIAYEAMDTFFNGRYGFITPDTYLSSPFPDYVPAPQFLKDKYGFITEDSGLQSNGDPGTLII